MNRLYEVDPKLVTLDSDLYLASHLTTAIDALDRHFGEGFGKKNPAMVLSLVQSGAMLSAATLIAREIGRAGTDIAEAIASEADG